MARGSSVKVPPSTSNDDRSKLAKPLVLSASSIARAQLLLSASAFLSAFAIGCYLHYKKIVKNGVAGYPQEWLPSVSSTIGDWYPERNVFQILIALTAPPRFAILFLSYYLNRSKFLFSVGVLRTIFCGGWIYITSSDSGLAHDVFMIGYIVLNVPWMVGMSQASQGKVLKRKRSTMATAFFLTLVPLIYFYIQHKVKRVPGAYSYYAIFEWSLIGLDVVFDSFSELEFREAGTKVTIGSLTSPPRLTQDSDTDSVMNASKVHEQAKEASDEAMKDALDAALAPTTAVVEANKTNNVNLLSFSSDLYLSFVFWSTFTALIPSLFYFSVWELGVAGQELALLTLLSPILLTSGLAVQLSTRLGQSMAYWAQFSALAAFLSKSPLYRLGIVAISCAVMMQREVILLAGLVTGEGTQSGKGVGYWSIVTTLGFTVASLSKHANHGNNPIWPFIDAENGGYNVLGLTLALMAFTEFSMRPTPNQLTSVVLLAPTKQIPTFWTTFFTTSVPLGSLLFSLHNLLADPSSLIAASWTGWENGAPRGPLPHVYGCVTMAVMALGLGLGVWGIKYSSAKPNRANPFLSLPWLFAGCLGCLGMYKERNWTGYGSSLLLALVLISAAPAIISKASEASRSVGVPNDDREGPGLANQCATQLARTWSSAMFVYILFNLASIFTAAYAFVPGGWVFRERTDAVLTAQMLCLALAFNWPSISSPSFTTHQASGISAPARKYTYASLALITVASFAATLYRLPMVPPKPHKPASRMVQAGIWTVHFGMNNEGRDSQRGMRNLIKDMQLDIVGLLETDLHRTAFGHRDLTRVMVEELGFNVDIGPGPNSHTWGAVLLTKFPIINTTHHLLPSPHGELAPAIEAVLDIYGTEVTVVVSHNGQEEDPLDRELQSTELARIMRESPRPVIFLGYVVTKPHQPRPHPYQIMVEDGNVFDIEQEDKGRWCEYIFYRGVYRTGYARVSRGIITDTELQIGQFIVPRPGVKAMNDDVGSRYIRANKEDVPEEHRFPEEYHGTKTSGGKNGHWYHVWRTPLLYRLPENAPV